MIFFPGQKQTAQYSKSGVVASLPVEATYYIFDAVIRISHRQYLRKTSHPVQTGANISDHAYLEPARVMLEVMMSDAMDQYTPGMWAGYPSKSVSCYNTLLALQQSRIPLQLGTRLFTYSNMVIEGLAAEDSHRTVAGLTARVELGQIFVASTQTITNSARPQDTNSTGMGAVNAQDVPASIDANYMVFQPVPAHTPVNSQLTLVPAHVPGAGNYSSVNTNNLANLPSAK